MLRLSIISISAVSVVSNFLVLTRQTMIGLTPSILLLIIFIASIMTLLIALFAWEKVGIDQDFTLPSKVMQVPWDVPDGAKKVILGRENSNKIPDSLPRSKGSPPAW